MHHHPGVSIMDFTSGRSSGNETSNVVKESLHVYEVMPRKDKRGVDLTSDALPFGRLWKRATIVFDCRTANDPASMSSTISA